MMIFDLFDRSIFAAGRPDQAFHGKGRMRGRLAGGRPIMYELVRS
jgi:hypothetical protein